MRARYEIIEADRDGYVKWRGNVAALHREWLAAGEQVGRPLRPERALLVEIMRAVRAHTRGGWEQLVYEQAPRPRPGPGEVLVAVQAASVTSGELSWEETWTDSVEGTGQDRTPIIPSHEMSGVIAALGAGVTGLSVGDQVYGLIPFVGAGAAAEYVAVPTDALAAKPVSVDHVHAAAVPRAGLTAWQALAGFRVALAVPVAASR